MNIHFYRENSVYVLEEEESSGLVVKPTVNPINIVTFNLILVLGLS